MRYLSLFSGVEAATVAYHPLGWECVAVAEIEPFPCAVLQHHYPNTPNLGDISKITKEQIINLGHIDIVVGGFPCQDVSVAGLRKGLEHDGEKTRSGLFFDAMRIVRWCREFNGTRFLLIENVPGLLSSKLGADFASILGEMVGSAITPPKGKWKNSGVVIGPDGMCEWGILDAQYFGVPQRRRRVFALTDFGKWADRPPILLEPESLCGNPPPSRKAGESTSHSVSPCIGASGRGFSRVGEIRGTDPVVACLIGMGEYAESEIGSPVRRSGGDCGGGSETLLCVATGQAGAEKAENLSVSLTCNHEAPIICYAVRTAHTSANGCGIAEEVAYTLEQANGQAVAACLRSGGDGGVPSSRGENLVVVHGTQTTAFALGRNNGGENVVAEGSGCGAVRRLTPKECERLQGFPDDYTNIPWRGKETAPDGPRYKAMGNSMAVPVMRWIGERINFIDFLYGE
jgi:DNA (cytosine-5)-methyltransferase 1